MYRAARKFSPAATNIKAPKKNFFPFTRTNLKPPRYTLITFKTTNRMSNQTNAQRATAPLYYSAIYAPKGYQNLGSQGNYLVTLNGGIRADSREDATRRVGDILSKQKIDVAGKGWKLLIFTAAEWLDLYYNKVNWKTYTQIIQHERFQFPINYNIEFDQMAYALFLFVRNINPTVVVRQLTDEYPAMHFAQVLIEPAAEPFILL